MSTVLIMKTFDKIMKAFIFFHPSYTATGYTVSKRFSASENQVIPVFLKNGFDFCFKFKVLWYNTFVKA